MGDRDTRRVRRASEEVEVQEPSEAESAQVDESSQVQDGPVVVESKQKRKGRKKGSKVPSQAIKPRQISKLLECKLKNMPVAQAARAAKLPVSTAQRALERYASWIEDIKDIQDFEGMRTQILTAHEMRLLESMMATEKLEKASVNNVAYALRQVHDMRRLHQGLSTANVATQKVEVSLPKMSDKD